MHSQVSGMRLLSRVVAASLAAELCERDVHLSREDLEKVAHDYTDLILQQRVVAVVLAMVDRLAGPSVEHGVLSAVRSDQQRSCFRAAHDQHRVLDALGAAGVRALTIKGLSLAKQTTGDMTARGAGDIDILVPGGDLSKTFRTLEGAGLLVAPGYIPPPHSRLFERAIRLQSQAVFSVGGRHVDLHWRLDPVDGGLSWTFDELWERRQPLDVGGYEVVTLSTVDSAVFSAANGARDSWSTLRHIVDHARLLGLINAAEGRARAEDVGALNRWEVAEVMVEKLIGEPVVVSGRSRKRANQMWGWLIDGLAPGHRGGLGATSRRFLANVGLYDNPQSTLRRLELHCWPVEAMATRDLGVPGDRQPWLYAVAAPVFLVQRAVRLLSRP